VFHFFFRSVRQIKPSIIPLFWFNASAVVDPGTRDYLYYNIVVLQTVGYAVTFAVFFFGVMFLALLIACCCSNRLKSVGKKKQLFAENFYVASN
jgi:hypothetical protein